MKIQCEGCDKNFSIDNKLIKPDGSKVRCSKCKHVFIVYRPAEETDAEPLLLKDVVEPSSVLKNSFDKDEFNSNPETPFEKEISGNKSSLFETDPELAEIDGLLAEHEMHGGDFYSDLQLEDLHFRHHNQIEKKSFENQNYETNIGKNIEKILRHCSNIIRDKVHHMNNNMESSLRLLEKLDKKF